MRDKSNTSALIFERELPGEGAYHFSNGPKHESPCMSSYWRGIGAKMFCERFRGYDGTYGREFVERAIRRNQDIHS